GGEGPSPFCKKRGGGADAPHASILIVDNSVVKVDQRAVTGSTRLDQRRCSRGSASCGAGSYSDGPSSGRDSGTCDSCDDSCRGGGCYGSAPYGFCPCLCPCCPPERCRSG